MIYNVYKKRGETPLECIKRFAKVFAKSDPEIIGQKMTYMGRLDPLAEGVMLAASGEDVKRKEEFLGLDKEYEFTAIFGFATDTYDILGKVVRVEKLKQITETDLAKVAIVYEGERDQKYPKYSSKMIAKKKASPLTPPLGGGEWGGAEIPTKKINIYKIQFHKLDVLSNKELFGRLLMDISKVQGDFRQTEILILWKELLFKFPKNQIFLAKFSAHVSSGTYIRSLVNDMGNTLGCAATTLSIKRTRVGDFKIEDSLK